MNYSLKTRVIAMLLAVVMVSGMMPVSAFAAEGQHETEVTEAAAAQLIETSEETTEASDETTEASDETTEASDETTEASDETTEASEETTEASEETTEASEETTEATEEIAEASYTVEHYLQTGEEEYTLNAELTQTLTGEVGANTAAEALILEGYAAKTVEQQVIAAEGTVVKIYYDVAAEAEPAAVTAEYKVEHYIRTTEGYSLKETETLSGDVGSETAAEAKTYDGYEARDFAQVEILADGSAIVEIYYDVAVSTNEHGLPSEMSVITNKESTLAPGVTMNEIALYDKNGARVEMQLTISDTSVDTVHFYANYKDNQCASWGMQTLSEQVAAMEANYEEPFKVVAGLNASYYNVTTGAPTGAFVMEGVDVSTNGDGYSFFAVLKDGTVMIGSKGEYSKYKGQIKEAIGGYIHLVKNGVVCAGLDKTTKYPRQTIGITADGKVITMTADGSQAPQTVGLTVQEQAEVMQALGCVEALHLDGGNSATFGAVREGADTFTTVNSPSGGAERAVSNTLMIVSTAVADGTFDHAIITSAYDYFVPNTAYTFSAFGVDAANGAAEIPETAVWTLSDDSFGTIENGAFVSSGKLGDVDIQLADNGKVIGSRTVSIVTPTAVSFANAETTVPYGKTAALVVTAMYGNNEALCAADSFNWSVDPAEAGTMNGFDFTAASESNIAEATVTAAYKYDDTVASASIIVKFGKGSEVLFDFEDGDISDWQGTDTINDWIDEQNAANGTAIAKPETYSNNIGTQSSSVFLASEKDGGRVKSGKYSLGFRMNHLNVDGIGSWVYNYLYYTGETKVLRDVAAGKTAVRIGMWVYSPDITNVAFRIVRGTEDTNGSLGIKYSYMTSDYDGVKTSYATNYAIPEAGWIYVYYDLTDVVDTIRQTTSVYNPDAPSAYYPAFLQLFTGSATDTMNDMIFYIDDITLDFSDVTDDRDAPAITNVSVSSDTANFVALNGQTVDNNLLSFSANISDVSGNGNATGLNYSTAKIYIDGVDMSGKSGFHAGGGVMSLNDVNLTNGTHSVAFVVFDNQGNETRVTKTLTVNGTAGNSVVYLEGRNEGNHTPKAGSVYYIDVKAADASQIAAVTTTLKLNTANTFEYSNIICAEGVTVVPSYDALDFALTLKITHDGTQTGETALVSVPVRVWSWDEAATGITAASQFASGAIPVIDIECETIYGKVTYADGAFSDYVAGFHTALDVATELDNTTAWHAHSAAAVADKAPDCTHAGYTGRTYCAGCASVVSWGTVIPATGHTYELGEDGILDCACGETFTGIWEDGKEYENGVCLTGWRGDSYYKDGVKVTGIQKVPAPNSEEEFYYDFGEEGVCSGKVKYEGLFLDEAAGVYRYSKVGVASGGWFQIEGDWYFFDNKTLAAAETLQYNDFVTYEFEETGKLASGVWASTLFGSRYYYGPGYYSKGWQTIDGKDYFFENSYCLTGGYQQILDVSGERTWFFFNEDGTCDKTTVIPDGFYTDRNGYGYSKDGKGFEGLQLIDGTYYYFNYHGYALSGTYAGRLFGDDFKAYTGLLEKDGTLYYYENGVTGTYGLTEFDGDYYFVYWGGTICTGIRYVGTTLCDLPAGTYEFGADGKMLQGVVEKEDGIYYYVNGNYAEDGLYCADGEYYAIKGGKAQSGTQVVEKSFCDLPAGTYEFGADCRMYNGLLEKDGTLYYYVNGRTGTYGLFEIDGDYYYVYWGGVVKTGQQYVGTTYCDLPAGNYEFGADGKMLNGIVEKDGTLYHYVNGKTGTYGLYEIDGGYYYIYWGGVVKTGQQYVGTTCCDLPIGNYEFGADGKMLNGIVEKDGTLYHYVNGKTGTYGLFEIDGDYYYVYWGGVVKTGQQYVGTTYCDLPAGNYEFGADGKMLNGVVEKDGTQYLYKNGITTTYGLFEIDGEYYYSYWGGVVMTGQQYVGTTYCDLPVGNYEFGEDGRMLNGFVERDGEIYYYVDGKTPAPGLIEVDGDFYFVNWGGVLVRNQTFFVWETNGLVDLKMNYTFDASGKIVG